MDLLTIRLNIDGELRYKLLQKYKKRLQKTSIISFVTFKPL